MHFDFTTVFFQVVLDGVNVNTAYPNTAWKDVPSTAVGGKTALVTAYFNITSGTHTITTLQDDTKFMCIVYGAGDRESYAYMGGMRLKVSACLASNCKSVYAYQKTISLCKGM